MLHSPKSRRLLLEQQKKHSSCSSTSSKAAGKCKAAAKAVPKSKVKEKATRKPVVIAKEQRRVLGAVEKKAGEADYECGVCVNEWGNVPAKACTSCEQDTHHHDRDAPHGSPRFLRWLKKRMHADGRFVPSGDECYGCFQCRRKHFIDEQTKLPVTLEKFLDMRKGTELDNRFYELRHDKVSGAGNYKKEGAQDVKIYTTQKGTTFSKRFTEGILFASRYPTSPSMGSGLYEITCSVACSLARSPHRLAKCCR